MERRLSFGSAAELYDRMRPSYPSQLVDDVLAFADMSPAEQALEVGVGTGKATLLFAARGLPIQGIEPSPEMAALARGNCAAYGQVRIEQAEFESWEPRERNFGLVYAAQAWHWIRPEVRYAKARSLLRPGGTLAAFWNRPLWQGCSLAAQIEAVYRTIVPEMAEDAGPMRPSDLAQPELWGDPGAEIEADTGYEPPERRDYPWTRSYSTAQYLDLLQTHSDHIMLDEQRRSALLAEIGAVIDGSGGRLDLPYVTRLTLARAACDESP